MKVFRSTSSWASCFLLSSMIGYDTTGGEGLKLCVVDFQNTSERDIVYCNIDLIWNTAKRGVCEAVGLNYLMDRRLLKNYHRRI